MAKHAGNSRLNKEEYFPIIHDFEETKSIHGLTLLEYMELPKTVRRDLTDQIKSYLNARYSSQEQAERKVKQELEKGLKGQ